MKTLLTLILTTCIIASSFAQKENDQYLDFKNSKEYNEILRMLKNKATYDDLTEVSYIFEKIPNDKNILAVAQQNNIFFALPNSLNITANNQTDINLLKRITSDYKKVANGIFEVTINGDIVKKYLS